MYIVYKNPSKIINLDNFDSVEVLKDDYEGFYVGAVRTKSSFTSDYAIDSRCYRPRNAVMRLTRNVVDYTNATSICEKIIDEILSGAKFMESSEIGE